ncbi:hypothetical protein BDN71DRAFT_1452006 [Pleurotus eryngii]|uniref:Uncharacterized protein n=1 Tax=Pleurotus eryngii TaxID=5323 RepID=A0A9P5ZS14_PLEER|nr:hypothetical protein BDN71DRAFT_1452006 [Pleurotus eryngii]
MCWKGRNDAAGQLLNRRDERNEVVAWYWWHDYEWEESPEIPASRSTIETTLEEMGPEDYSALYEEIGVALLRYGRAMPSLREAQYQKIPRRYHRSPTDLENGQPAPHRTAALSNLSQRPHTEDTQK